MHILDEDWPNARQEGHAAAADNHAAAAASAAMEVEEDADVRRLRDVLRRSPPVGFGWTASTAFWRSLRWEVDPSTFDAAAERFAVAVGIAA